jgi:hypothetical protein
MHSHYSVHQSVAQSVSCRRERKQALNKCSYFPLMTSPELTRCQKMYGKLHSTFDLGRCVARRSEGMCTTKT